MAHGWRVHRGPVEIEGGAIARVVVPEDGGNGRVETWSAAKRGWVPGGATLADFFDASALSPERAKELGIPPQGPLRDLYLSHDAAAEAIARSNKPVDVIIGPERDSSRFAENSGAVGIGSGWDDLRREFRKGTESAKIRSPWRGIQKGLLLGVWLAIALSLPIAWYWRVVVLFAGTYVTGLIVQARLMARERRESAAQAQAQSAHPEERCGQASPD